MDRFLELSKRSVHDRKDLTDKQKCTYLLWQVLRGFCIEAPCVLLAIRELKMINLDKSRLHTQLHYVTSCHRNRMQALSVH